MDIWQIVLSIIIAYLGLPIGLVVATTSKEEIIQGKTYIAWLHKLMVGVGVLLATLWISIWLALPLAVAVFALQWIPRKPRWTCYILWSVLIFVALMSNRPHVFLWTISMAFLFGFTYSSLWLSEKKYRKWRDLPGHVKHLMAKLSWFPVLTIILAFTLLIIALPIPG